MFNTDEFYKTIERKMLVNPLRSTGEIENSFFQHLGRYYNKEIPYPGELRDKIIAEVERKMIGQKKHGFEQNKMTESEKMQRDGDEYGRG